MSKMGSQTINYLSPTLSLKPNLSTGTSSGADGNDFLVAIEDIHGSVHNDYLTGNSDKNIIHAHSRNDIVHRDGGNDRLYGNAGNDKIDGGSGADIFNGGSGNDSFDFSSLTDCSINAMDEIQDFEQGLDKVNLSAIEKDLSFDSFEFIVENGHTVIKDKNSDFAIDLQGQFNLNGDDFIL